MKPFLKEIAEKLMKEAPALDKLTLVFPNRRAILYFKKYLAEILNRPAFAPPLLTIEEFISQFSTNTVPDKLELVHRLHAVYRKEINSEESFDRFYFWGDMLLRDFDEVDKYLVPAELLFKDLRHQKEMDAVFDYLTSEQQEFLKSFWINFDEHLTDSKVRFLDVWVQLHSLYQAYREQLQAEGLAYEGMLHREVANLFTSESIQKKYVTQSLHFIGFNALTGAEEKIISSCLANGWAQIHWDGDQYYVNTEKQEAGTFLKSYQTHPILKTSFLEQFPAHFRQNKKVNIYGAAQSIGQAKLLAQVVEQLVAQGMKEEETLIVLPDEKMLMPVLHGISTKADKMNVTMGFALSNTPFFNLVELLVDLQIHANRNFFNHRSVLALLAHPYVVASDAAAANAKRRDILGRNWVQVPGSYLQEGVYLHQLIFHRIDFAEGKGRADLLQYMKKIIHEIGSLENITDFDREYAFHFIKLFNRVEQVLFATGSVFELGDATVSSFLKSFLRLIRQLVRAQKIPFTGEPLKGMQIMGVLETRNLDFKNVFIISLNEGAFPSFGGKGSYIPYNIRKAYGLPTIEHQDAIYAYLFYRVLQRAENIHLFYNSESDVLGQGEMSRYLQQLIYESGLPIQRHVLHNPVQPNPIEQITIRKDAGVMEALSNLNAVTARFRGISPSALNAYIECRLKFYFQYVAHIKEPKEVVEDIDARVLGNFLHNLMELFYKHIREKKKSKLIEAGDFVGVEETLAKLFDHVFMEVYHLEPGKIEYEGQRLVVREVVKSMALRILERDKEWVPFFMEAVEQEGLLYNVKISHAPGFVVLGGKIDRVDRKGNELRIVDYKTGGDKLDFKSIESLFARNEKRNKAVFQILLYTLLYKNNLPKFPEPVKLRPGLINRVNLFEEKESFGIKLDKEIVTDAEPLLPEFEEKLRLVLEEMYDPTTVFDQTTNTDICRLCAYKGICYRS